MQNKYFGILKKLLYYRDMDKISSDTYIIRFDYKPGETEPIVLLENITNVLQGFENFNKAVCRGIDNDLEVSSYLVDIESGSIKVKVRDVLQKIPDGVIIDLCNEPKKVLGQFLVFAKYKIIKALKKNSDKPQIEKENAVYETLQRDIKDSGVINPLLSCEINKNDLFGSISEITSNAKKIDKVSLEFDDVREAEIIDADFDYIEPSSNNKMAQTVEAELMIKKPDLFGSSKWDFIFDKQISATIEDEDFLKGIREKKIGGFYSGDKIKCRLRIEAFLNEKLEPEETKYYIEKVLKLIKSVNEPLLFSPEEKI